MEVLRQREEERDERKRGTEIKSVVRRSEKEE